MRFYICSWIIVFLIGLPVGCSSDHSSFAGKSPNTSSDETPQDKTAVIEPNSASDAIASGSTPTETFVDVIGGNDSSVPDVAVANGSALSFRFDPATAKYVEGTSEKLPLAIYFVVDVTGSMQGNIDAIKSNIVDFANNLQGRGFDLKLGFVPFRDNLPPMLHLTSDITSFVSFVSSQKATGGGDVNEASLLAVSTAVDNIVAESSSDTFNAILVITDQPGHGGGNRATGCAIEPLAAKLNDLSVSKQKMLRIYYSTPDAGTTCAPYADASSQWGDLLTKGLKDVPVSERGTKLGYPFTSSVLISDFASTLEKDTPGFNQICLASRGDLQLKDAYHWQASSLSDVYQLHLNHKPIEWRLAVPATAMESVSSDPGSFVLTRCCVKKEEAQLGNFSGCVEKTQTTSFKVKLSAD